MAEIQKLLLGGGLGGGGEAEVRDYKEWDTVKSGDGEYFKLFLFMSSEKFFVFFNIISKL